MNLEFSIKECIISTPKEAPKPENISEGLTALKEIGKAYLLGILGNKTAAQNLLYDKHNLSELLAGQIITKVDPKGQRQEIAKLLRTLGGGLYDSLANELENNDDVRLTIEAGIKQ